MPSVFLSYSRSDVTTVQQLETGLKANGLAVWRDQEKIYGGQKWPKVLGEAIADQDVLLLAWSKNAAESHFVEFEWTTALALKKTIVPCLLDSTTLHPSLAATHGILISDLPRILAAITGVGSKEDVKRRVEVVSKLERITATKAEEVLVAAKGLFDQRGWVVQGNVIQGEHVTVTIGQKHDEKPKGLLERWQTWVSLAVGILTVVTLILGILDKLPWPSSSNAAGKAFDQPLAGQVIDASTGDPLPGVRIAILDFTIQPQATNEDGHFRFEKVRGAKQERIKLTIGKNCYKVETIDATLGNTDLRPALDRLNPDRCKR